MCVLPEHAALELESEAPRAQVSVYVNAVPTEESRSRIQARQTQLQYL